MATWHAMAVKLHTANMLPFNPSQVNCAYGELFTLDKYIHIGVKYCDLPLNRLHKRN